MGMAVWRCAPEISSIGWRLRGIIMHDLEDLIKAGPFNDSLFCLQ
jgi:hypothetical protein